MYEKPFGYIFSEVLGLAENIFCNSCAMNLAGSGPGNLRVEEPASYGGQKDEFK